MRQQHPELGPGLDAVHKEQMEQQLLWRSKVFVASVRYAWLTFIHYDFEQVVQGLSGQPSEVKQDLQPGKRRKTAVEEKPKEGKKSKVVAKKVLKTQLLSGNDSSAAAVIEKYGSQGQAGENQTDDILSKYKFLTVTKPATPLKLKNTGSVQRKGVAKIKAKDGAKKVKKAGLQKVNVAHLERGEEEGLEEKAEEDVGVSSRSPENQVEGGSAAEQMESTATTPVEHVKEESETTVEDDEENTVDIANILNKYKFMTNAAVPREAEEVDEVTMEETTEEDLLGKAEGQENAGSDLVEATVMEGKEQSVKIIKKSSSAAAMRKDNVKEKVPCEHCDKTFASSSTLKQHITIHTKETPYQCKECPEKFRNSNMLLLHKKKVHPKSSLPEKTGTVPPTPV